MNESLHLRYQWDSPSFLCGVRVYGQAHQRCSEIANIDEHGHPIPPSYGQTWCADCLVAWRPTSEHLLKAATRATAKAKEALLSAAIRWNLTEPIRLARLDLLEAMHAEAILLDPVETRASEGRKLNAELLRALQENAGRPINPYGGST